MDAEPSVEARDAAEFDRLLRFMTRPGRRFGLALAIYADERVAAELRELACTQAPVHTTTLVVDASERIANSLVKAANGFDVIFVKGLDGIAEDVAEDGPLTRAVIDLNFQRDTLPELLDVRVVFWISMDAYAQLVRLAPDLLDVMLSRFEFLAEREAPPEPEPLPRDRPAWMLLSPSIDLSVLERQAESFAATAQGATNEFAKADAAASAGQLFAAIDRLEDAVRWLDEAATRYERIGKQTKEPLLTLAAAIQFRRAAEVAQIRGDVETARRLAERSVEAVVPTKAPLEQLRSLAVLAALPGGITNDDNEWQSLDKTIIRYFNQLRTYFTKLVPENDVENLLQETLIRLFEYRSRHERSPLRSVVFRIARKVAVEYYSRRPHKVDRHDFWGAVNVDDRIGSIIQQENLIDALEILSAQDREILQLYYWEQLHGAELAKRFGLTEAATRSRLRAAKQRLISAYKSLSDHPANERALTRSLARLRTSETS